jgi:DNA-binding transcriptional LysR family regulator
MFDLVRMRSFAEVAERGTVVAAATTLGYTPPAVSQHLAKLEGDLGRPLFDRAAGRLTLNAAGARLLPFAREMIDLADRARLAVSEPPGRQRYIVAGFASAISVVLVPRMSALRSTMDLDIVEAEDAEAMRDLTSGTVDLVLSQEYDGMAVDRSPRYHYTPLLRDELQLVLPAGWPATTRIADLADEPWLLNGDATLCAEAARQLLATRNIQPHVVGTVNDNTALLALVAAGHGATIVPSSIVGGHPDVVVSSEQFGIGRTILGVARTAVLIEVQPLIDQLTAGDDRAAR